MSKRGGGARSCHFDFILGECNSFIYSVEKTLVDLFRYRKKIGDDIVLECLRNYLKENKNNVNKLIACAKLFGMVDKMFPIIRAMVV